MLSPQLNNTECSCQQNEISSLSRENTFDADDWIIQAKQLHADIERSRVTAREIVAQHEHTNPLRSKVEDAEAKVELIETEIAFNQAVAETLEEVQRLCQQLENGRTALSNGEIAIAIQHLEVTKATVQEGSFFTNTNVMSILSAEVTQLQQEIEDAVRQRWSQQLNFDRSRGTFEVTKAEGIGALDETIALLSQLDIFVPASDKLQGDLLSVIIDPILLPRRDGSSHGVTITETGIHVEHELSQATIAETLARIKDVLEYLRQLPQSISATFPQTFIPAVASKAISGWLSSSIPTDLDGLGEFEKTLGLVLDLTKTLESWGWSGHEELVSWVNQAPRLWLTRRRVHSLDSVRKALAASKGTFKQVERIEKEKISQTDGALLEKAPTDEWDAGWDDEKEESATDKAATTELEDDEEDVSAWGLDEDTPEEIKPTTTAGAEDDDDVDDAWGWGDDDEGDKGEKTQQTQVSPATNPPNGEKAGQASGPREVTLKEVYTITDIPDAVLQIVQQQITDSNDISQPPWVFHTSNALHIKLTIILGIPILPWLLLGLVCSHCPP